MFRNKEVGFLCKYFLAFLLVYLFVQATASQAYAVGFTDASMRSSRMAISIATSTTDPILVVLKSGVTATEASIGISFATGYTVNATASNILVSTAGLPSTYHGMALTAMPGVGSAASAVTGQNVTFNATNLTVGTAYGFYITGGITNPATTGNKISTISTHTDGTPDFAGYTDAIEVSRIATYIVSDNGAATDSDQIVVTARVFPSYSLVLSSQSITLDTDIARAEYPGGLSNGAVSAITATATTNANNGHIMWLRANTAGGLTSATTASSIAFYGTTADGSPTTLVPGTEGVVVDVDLTTNTSGSLAIAGEFNGSGTCTGSPPSPYPCSGGTPSTTFQEIASATGPVGGAGDVVTIIPRVAISAITQAADDYTNTFTVIGAGDF